MLKLLKIIYLYTVKHSNNFHLLIIFYLPHLQILHTFQVIVDYQLKILNQLEPKYYIHLILLDSISKSLLDNTIAFSYYFYLNKHYTKNDLMEKYICIPKFEHYYTLMIKPFLLK